MSATAGLIASPCVGLCKLDTATGWCLGCGRSGDELLGWGELSAERQRVVWSKLPARMATLGRPVRVLPWAAASLLERLAQVAALPGTVWSIGDRQGSAELMASPRAALESEIDEGALVVRHPLGALRLRLVAGLRAFLHATDAEAQIILALHQSRLRLPVPATVTDLGPDAGAIMTTAPAARLFDLGLGSTACRFCVRAETLAVRTALERAEGQPPASAPDLLARLVAASPPRVLLTPAVRLEVTAPIPPADGTTPIGPHTHLDLDARELEPPVLPEGYRPVARVFASDKALRTAGLDG